MTNNLPFPQAVLSLCTAPLPSHSKLCDLCRKNICITWLLQWPTTPFILKQPVQCHLGAPSRHLHCLLCALIGRVAGSQWLDCQMTSKKGFKLVESARHCAQPSHQLVYGGDITETCSSFPFCSLQSFRSRAKWSSEPDPAPTLGEIWHGQQIHGIQFEAILRQHFFLKSCLTLLKSYMRVPLLVLLLSITVHWCVAQTSICAFRWAARHILTEQGREKKVSNWHISYLEGKSDWVGQG